MQSESSKDKSLAIAYAIRRRNQKKYMGGKVEDYADGGEVEVPRGTVLERIMQRRRPEEELLESEPVEIEGHSIPEDMDMKMKRALEGDEHGDLEGESMKSKRHEMIRKALSKK